MAPPNLLVLALLEIAVKVFQRILLWHVRLVLEHLHVLLLLELHRRGCGLAVRFLAMLVAAWFLNVVAWFLNRPEGRRGDRGRKTG